MRYTGKVEGSAYGRSQCRSMRLSRRQSGDKENKEKWNDNYRCSTVQSTKEKSTSKLKGSANVGFSKKTREGVASVREGARYAFPMRKTEVPQFGQTPLTAGLPFLSVTFCGFLISMLVLHFTQYAVGISFSTERG